MRKHHTKLFFLLTPSTSSLIVSTVLSIFVMISVGFAYQAGNGTIYDYLFGPTSSAESIASSKSTLSALNDTILGNEILNKVLYFAFWMLIGLVVYIILFAILRGGGAAAEDIKESSYTNIKKEKLFNEFAIKSTVRLAAIFSWIVFTIIFFKVLLPFSSLAARTAAEDMFTVAGFLYSLYGFVVLMLSFHIEVILIRLMFLRVRLFAQEEIES